MDSDKLFIKTFLKTFEDESFAVRFWDGEEIKVGDKEPLFKIILNILIYYNNYSVCAYQPFCIT